MLYAAIARQTWQSTLASIWTNFMQCDNATMIFFGKPGGVKIIEPISQRPPWNRKGLLVDLPNRVTVAAVEAQPIPEGAWD